MGYAWIPVVIVVLALGIYLVARILDKKPKKDHLEDAKQEAAEVKAKADAQLAAELQEVDADKGKLAEIKEIPDDAARLQALADYANRGQK